MVSNFNVTKKFRKTPSAARFCAKGFEGIDFWTSFMSISWKFFDSCANSFRNLTKLIYGIRCKKEEHDDVIKY